ncbi:ComEC family competence protein [Maribacter sp. MJ134]|uniref:ComEC/Rec2 family competence protein n=1 Tax=Maribacter sp. MJ134 TaxID=2496865 RepID=UPI000F84A4DA|nr:ComEC/Rec2 family competence protein [Maribacter sp. MJ134]AZQ60282.1 ComEC family competence protein [Maribacter sp. MJ134]
MKLFAFVPVKLALLLIIGILIGRYFTFDISWTLGCTLALIITLSLYYTLTKQLTSTLFGSIAAATTIALGTLTYQQAQPINNSAHYSKAAFENNGPWQLKIKEVLKPSSFSQRYIATVNSLDRNLVSGKILLNKKMDTTALTLHVDDELWVYTRPIAIGPPLNPHQFDYKRYLEHMGIYHQLNLNTTNYIKSKTHTSTVYGLAAKARLHIVEKLKEQNFGADELGVIQALLLGQRSDLSEETYDNYKKAGAVHILAVSGLHIGILLLLIQFLLSPLRTLPKGNIVILVLSVVLLWGFAFLAGLSASIIRACTMFSFIAYALSLNRPSNTSNILSLSLFFILLFINPNLLFHIGFQMSYAAVFAIVWIYPLLQKLWFPKHKIVRYFWQLLSVSLAAQLGVLPISLYYFHQFPGLFFISNLLIVPVLGAILAIGILVILLSLNNALPDWLVWLFNKLILWMNTVVDLVAQQEAFIFKSIPFDHIQLVIGYIVILLMIGLLSKVTFKRLSFFLFGILGFQLWTMYADYNASKQKDILLLHQTRNTVLIQRNGRYLNVWSKDSLKSKNILTNFEVQERIYRTTHDTLRQAYLADNQSFLIIDSLGIFPAAKEKNIILLTDSPKINLERLIRDTRPKLILVDGSNYKSYVARWKNTCKKAKLPFHYTGEMGAYSFISEPY